MLLNRTLKTRILFAIIATATMAVAFFLFVLAENTMSPGRSCFYEYYKFHCSKTKLINALEKFKSENPNYLLPEFEYLPNGAKVHLPYFEEIQYPPGYAGYLYNSEKNQIIHFNITNSIPIIKGDTIYSILGFVGVNEGLVLGNWKGVNDDFSGKENKEVKTELEQTVLDKLGVEYEKEGNSAPLFHNWFKHRNNPAK